MHWYETVRYLYVPPHGSPKTLLLATIVQIVSPLHVFFTVSMDVAAWQFWLLVALCGQTSGPWARPYDALRTSIFAVGEMFEHVSVTLSCSHVRSSNAVCGTPTFVRMVSGAIVSRTCTSCDMKCG